MSTGDDIQIGSHLDRRQSALVVSDIVPEDTERLTHLSPEKLVVLSDR